MSWLNTDTGSLTLPVLAAETINPSFLAVHPSHRFLYSVGQVESPGGTNYGAVNAFAIDAATGKLTFLNQRDSSGEHPCHVAVDKTGKCVLVANYNSGSFAAFPVQPDGSLGSVTSVDQHHGSGINLPRQEGPHAHGVGFDLANQRAFCTDLGADRIYVYRFDPTKNTITPNQPPFAVSKPGAGPRHFAMDPSGRRLYVINEINSTVAAFNYDAPTGVLRKFQTISTLPDTFGGTNAASEIAVHSTGRFLYAGNRGHNSISVYTIDDTTGRLTLIQHQSTLGKTPRNFAIDPTGKYILAANQDSNTVVVFRIDSQTGRLTPTGQTIEVPVPICVVFLMRG
jgi:6-phosphogluconolactonase